MPYGAFYQSLYPYETNMINLKLDIPFGRYDTTNYFVGFGIQFRIVLTRKTNKKVLFDDEAIK